MGSQYTRIFEINPSMGRSEGRLVAFAIILASCVVAEQTGNPMDRSVRSHSPDDDDWEERLELMTYAQTGSGAQAGPSQPIAGSSTNAPPTTEPDDAVLEPHGTFDKTPSVIYYDQVS